MKLVSNKINLDVGVEFSTPTLFIRV